MSEKTKTIEQIPMKWKYSIRAGLIVFLLWLTIFIVGLRLPVSEPINYREMFGQLGDAFGMLNGLVGGITIAFAIYTIAQQTDMIQKQEEQHLRDRKDARDAVTMTKIEEASRMINDLFQDLTEYSSVCDIEVPSVTNFARKYNEHCSRLKHIKIVCAIHAPSIEDKITMATNSSDDSFKELSEYIEALHQSPTGDHSLKARASDKQVRLTLELYSDLLNLLLAEAKRLQLN